MNRKQRDTDPELDEEQDSPAARVRIWSVVIGHEEWDESLYTGS